MTDQLQLVSVLYKKSDLEDLLSLKDKAPAAIVGCHEVSRYIDYGLSDCLEIVSKLKQHGIKVYLQWDALMTQNDFVVATHFLSHVDLTVFDGVRVQDPGALHWLSCKQPQLPLHYIAETGHHNLVGIQTWLDLYPQIKRIVLSPELSSELLEKFRQKFSPQVELEILGAGRLLLFYTPRQLLSPLHDDKTKDETEAIYAEGTSEESPHKGFPLVENRHGTFMFNTKDLFIFDEFDAIKKLNNFVYRLDCLKVKTSDFVRGVYEGNPDSILSLKDRYPKPIIKGFFKKNKTDVLFKKLKNTRRLEKRDHFLGEVVDVKKKGHVGVLIRDGHHICVGDEVLFFTPEGREKKWLVKEMKNGALKKIDTAQGGQVVFFPPVGSISVRTLIKRISTD